ncbi:predicted protein [Postia placenta Mad-698-R]|uniref:AAA+ ATPase domain-containing protein n=1 Tax=Postia placenta MAD-698-R-SB12 TaxID=670580 RepID=A0A1X6MUV7_9APHY|nr:hypothetical protein POSPLADRAFT_1171148 [Postia placenta MAD-698-R-SB12]EED81272.1 predicted protein [Postia placenta Mad-698-R]OSX60164.1 hypothetical protein POSPLADRAFT_1171148 [Postia placenta MAD-698-R-SB12]
MVQLTASNTRNYSSSGAPDQLTRTCATTKADAGDRFYGHWIEQDRTGFQLLDFPHLEKTLGSPHESISSLSFIPFPRMSSSIPGTFSEDVKFGTYNVKWSYPHSSFDVVQHYILHKGPEARSRELLLAAAGWTRQLHEEILVFERGYWKKDSELWTDMQKASWDDIILKQEFKDELQQDVTGFFDSQKLYKSLAIPWKACLIYLERGIIMLGPPGNGKTISVKAIMKDCYAAGHAPLYVKSFKSAAGEEYSIAQVFRKAREMAPCVVVLEDLDSLINEGNRAFFLNQLDGLAGNDGLLVLASTNHFERLDPALSNRPSRFDRKYPFENPDEEERGMYAKYWQDKLHDNKGVLFPDSLVAEIAATTDGFSFAYLKEVFVASLVLLASNKKLLFASVTRAQIKSLRKQLEKDRREGNAQNL